MIIQKSVRISGLKIRCILPKRAMIYTEICFRCSGSYFVEFMILLIVGKLVNTYKAGV